MSLHLSRRAAIGSAVLLATCCAPLAISAQSTPSQNKILVINREFTKPGRDGAAHEATEAAYLRAAAAGKAPFHYVAMTSLTGPNRALFVSAYPSFEAVEAERKHMSAALNASLDKAMIADGDVLSETDQSMWIVDPELSQNTDRPRVGSRLLIAREFVLKPGHTAEWEQAVKMALDGYKKAGTGAHWTTYRLVYGNSNGPTYLVLTSVKSMSEVDDIFASDPKFVEAMGSEGLKKLEDLEASCLQSSHSNIFLIDPKMSIPTDEMIKAEPDFWKAKTTSGVARKPAAAKSSNASGQ